MANTIDALIPKILARSLLVLREQMVMPRLVNSDYSTDAKKLGSTIDVPVSTTKTVTNVVPSHADSAPDASVVTTVPVKLDQWKKTNFFLTDDEMNKIDTQGTFMPLEMQESVAALARNTNAFLLGLYPDVYGWAGAAGTTPFATTVNAATDARKVLNEQKAPKAGRRAVLDFTAEANALALPQFSDAEKVGSAEVKIEGEIGRKYGIDWNSDDQVITHVAGTVGGGSTPTAVKAATVHAVGVTSIMLTVGNTNAMALKRGDIVMFAGDAQTYAVIADAASGTATDKAITISPPLKKALAGGEVITNKATHVVNLAFHRDAFAFAQRTLLTNADGLGSKMMSMTDPQTGISLRLEVKRQNKQTVWEFDQLFGGNCVQPAYAARLAG